MKLDLRMMKAVESEVCERTVGWGSYISKVTVSGLDGRISIPGRSRYLSLLHYVHAGSGIHSAAFQWMMRVK